MAKELARYNIDIAALSETRFPGQGQRTESGSGYTFFWSGKEEGERREAGVGFAIKNSLVRDLRSLPVGVNERIMSMRLPLRGNQHLTLLSVYAPTMTYPDEIKEAFYLQLKEAVCRVPTTDKLIVLGDFNARVGSDCSTWSGVIGRHGLGHANSNGLLLLSFCAEHSLTITNTLFDLPDIHKGTWMHPRSKHWHMIDFIITRKRDIQDFRKTRALRGADCWTDHRLIRSKLKLRICRRKRPHGTKPPQRIDVDKLKVPSNSTHYNSVLAEKLQTVNALDGDLEKNWADIRDKIMEAAVETVGLRKRKSKDWFDDNDEAIEVLLAQRHSAYVEHLADPSNTSKKNRYLSLKATAQKRLRQMKDTWFQGKATLLQHYADTNNSKRFFSEMKSVYGPSSNVVTPMRAEDGKLITDIEDIQKRWAAHFEQLLNRPAEISSDAIADIEPTEPITALDSPPTEEEVRSAIAQLQCGKAGGPDGIPPELFKSGGPVLVAKLTAFFVNCWDNSTIPKDLKDARIVHLYKGKGDKSLCDNHRGISLLSIAGKILAKLILNRLTEHIIDDVVPESQCGFRPMRGTADMIFAVRQLQEKCREQQKDLYILFLDLTKAFDTVSRDGLWKILPRVGCPPKIVEIIRQFHEGMSAQIAGSDHSFPVTNGVKQGCVLAPTLFSILFSLMLTSAFKGSSAGIKLRYRTDRGAYDIRGLKARTKTTETLIRDLLYADDCAIVTHTEADLQDLTNRISAAAKKFGLTISIKKTEVMFQPSQMVPTPDPCILIDGQRLKNVEDFTYLGSCVTANCSLDKEITTRIAKASSSFGRLRAKVWNEKGLALKTKIAVYRAVVLPSLLYGSETWTTYRRHVRALEQFHQRCLRQIMGIKWQDRATNTSVLNRAGLTSIETMLMKNQLRWVGHIVRMGDSRLPKQVFYSELSDGVRRRGRPLLRYKDTLKEKLNLCNLPLATWEASALNRSLWRGKVSRGTAKFELEKTRKLEEKRAVRHRAPPTTGIKCPICDRICASNFGLMAHIKTHRPR